MRTQRTKKEQPIRMDGLFLFGPEGDNGFDTNTMKSAVSARVSELDASISWRLALHFDHSGFQFYHFAIAFLCYRVHFPHHKPGVKRMTPGLFCFCVLLL